jgi:hypothetical protein
METVVYILLAFALATPIGVLMVVGISVVAGRSRNRH